MLKDELVKCPVCGVMTRIDKPELAAVLANPEIREKIEAYVAELAATVREPATAAAAPSRNFQTDVHNWNPALPMWQRSPKE